tara:strand:- start:33 stop:368 length:336 start_codon:yes stop_codon:yes gene_type:complete
MTINSDVDIPLALQKLGKDPEVLGLTQSAPPHSINVWEKGESGDDQPTDDEINTAWTEYKKDQAATKYQRDREPLYASIKEQLDQLYWDKKNGTNKWVEAIDKVKSDNPKP